MKKLKREIISAAAFILAAVLLLALASAALRPVRTDYGAVWKPYLAEPKSSLDYLYLGSSYAYCDVNPGLIYEASGLTGYVLAGPEQTMSISYWYLKEALKTQKPQTVLIEASALFFDRYQNYTQVNVGYMPFSLNKLGAVFTASEPELRTGLLFDLYFYHSRWKELTLAQAAKALAPARTDQLKGFTAADGTFEQIADGPFRREGKEDAVFQRNMEDLGRIVDLCLKNGIAPIVVFHPTYSQLSTEDYDRVAAGLPLGAGFLNWSDDFDSSGLVPAEHFYDPGHLNQEGAALFSRWLGKWFIAEAGLTPRTQTARNAAAWRSTAEYWK